MADRSETKFGGLALALSLGGVVLAVTVALLARCIGHNAGMPAYLVFLAFQVAGLTLGLLARRTSLGKAAAITAGVLAVGSWVLMV